MEGMLAALRKRPSTRSLRHRNVERVDKSSDDGMLAPARTEMLGAQKSDTLTRPVSSGAISRHDRPKPARKFSDSETSRFSFKRNQYASDPQLSKSYQNYATSHSSSNEGAPAPIIGITAPPWDEETAPARKSRRFNLFSRRQSSFGNHSLDRQHPGVEPDVEGTKGKPAVKRKSHASLEQSPRPSSSSYNTNPPPPYAHSEEHRPSLAVPSTASQMSESSASDHTSGGDQYAYATTTTTHTISTTTTTFFKMRRRPKKNNKTDKKQPSLFPTPLKIPASDSRQSYLAPTVAPRPSLQSQTPSPSPRSASPYSAGPRPSFQSQAPHALRSAHTSDGQEAHISPVSSRIHPMPVTRKGSENSFKSTPNLPTHKHSRARSATATSDHSRMSHTRTSTPHLQDTTRTSTTSATLGRNSLAGIRSFTSKFRHSIDPNESLTPASAHSHMSKSEDTLVIPEREEGETAGKYFARLEQDIPKKIIAIILSKSSDAFSHDVLRSLMRTFKFYEEPMDIALRRFLWEIDLPGEAQQIDRVMSSFAERYHECNPHIFNDFDQAYLAAYSLIILHSDLFNKNNKKKMQRSEYQKNTGGQGIDEEILGYFYDNIQYTEFIAQNPDEDETEHKLKSTLRRPKRIASAKLDIEHAKPSKLDPYDFIIDDKLKLDILRPSLKDVMNLDDNYSYLGTSDRVDLRKVQSDFAHCSILQVVSARSRPEAFMSPSTITNPLESHPGLIDINVVKIGMLWRKDPKRRKARSPWQEWGALLTASQLYFFKNSGWIKGLIHQHDTFYKLGRRMGSLVFKPPLAQFRPDFSVRTLSAVALHDSSYKRHKHAFVLARHENHLEEVLLADDEDEMNDWLAKINYAAAYTASNIPIQPLRSDHKMHDDSTASPEEVESNFRPMTNTSRPHYGAGVSEPWIRQIGEGSSTPARRETLEARVLSAERNLRAATEKLYENLKTARHLQILAPFPPKTRSDLLSFGARVAHRVRWSRFEVWRLRCHSDILAKELQAHDRLDLEPILTGEKFKRNPLSPRPSALSRFNSKATAIIGSQRSNKQGKESPRNRSRNKYSHTHDADIAGIDQAFATPAETLSRTASAVEGPYKLPPLDLGSPEDNVAPMDQVTESAIDAPGTPKYQSSMASLHSQSLTQDIPDDASRVSTIANSALDDQEAESDACRPGSAIESDKEQWTQGSGLEGRNARVRRSLHRTLREARENIGRGSSRGRRGKESISSNGAEDASSTADGEGLSRGPGSFTVHGKKASVVTLGSEWQSITPEVLLRSRKRAQNEEQRMSLASTVEESGHTSASMDQVTEDTVDRMTTFSSRPSKHYSGGVEEAILRSSVRLESSLSLHSKTESVRLVEGSEDEVSSECDNKDKAKTEQERNEEGSEVGNKAMLLETAP